MTVLKRVAALAFVVSSTMAFSGHAQAKATSPPRASGGLEIGWVTIQVAPDSHATPRTVGGGGTENINSSSAVRNMVQGLGEQLMNSGYTGTAYMTFRRNDGSPLGAVVGSGVYDLDAGEVTQWDYSP